MSTLAKLIATTCRFIDGLTLSIGGAVRWLTLAIPVVCVGYALTRKLTHWGHNGFTELQWYLFAAVYLLSAGYTLLRDQHVRLDFFWRNFDRRTKCQIEIVFLVPLMLVCLLLAADYWDFWIISFKQNEGPEDVLIGLERWPLKLMLFLGFCLLALQSFSELLKRIAVLANVACESPADEMNTRSETSSDI